MHVATRGHASRTKLHVVADLFVDAKRYICFHWQHVNFLSQPIPFPPQPKKRAAEWRRNPRKLRVGFSSADFKQKATAYLVSSSVSVTLALVRALLRAQVLAPNPNLTRRAAHSPLHTTHYAQHTPYATRHTPHTTHHTPHTTHHTPHTTHHASHTRY